MGGQAEMACTCVCMHACMHAFADCVRVRIQDKFRGVAEIINLLQCTKSGFNSTAALYALNVGRLSDSQNKRIYNE